MSSSAAGPSKYILAAGLVTLLLGLAGCVMKSRNEAPVSSYDYSEYETYNHPYGESP